MKKLVSMLQLSALLMFALVSFPVFAAPKPVQMENLQQQAHAVRGVVSDAMGPMAGVDVIVNGTTNGVATDLNGTYILHNVPVGATLKFSFIGYKTQEILVTSQEVINILLEEDVQLLEELILIGYGTVRKSDLTGSVTSVGEEQMTKSATSDALQAIQGRAAGVQIITATGSPSATAEIKIRGTGSPNGTTPLYVVDGFPMNDIDYLSPGDISSIEILKDASACAIYGSRGANGVVLVTTRKGSAGALKSKVTAEYGIEALPTRPQMLNSSEYALLTNKAYTNSGLTPRYSNPNTMPHDTDWYGEVMRMGRYQNYNVSVSGGTEKINTLLSVGYFRRDGTVDGTNFGRFNITENTTVKMTSFLTITTSLQGSFAKSNSLGANGTNNNTIFLSSLIAPPDVPVWDESTNYYSGIGVIRLANPAGVISRNNNVSNRNFLIGNISADLTIIPGLVFTSRFGYKYSMGFGSDYSPVYYETANISDAIDTVTRSTSRSTDWSLENMLNYTKNWKNIHRLNVMIAMSAREFYTESYTGTKQDLPNSGAFYRFFDAASKNPQVRGNASELSMLSYLGRINYTLLNRYLLTVSFRADGSSRFMPSNRWGYFPSGAFAWKVSEEPFFKSVNKDVVSNLKFRIGWGQIGNERINSYYPYMTSIRQQQYYTIGTGKIRTNGSTPAGIGNPAVQWETSEQFNVGLDMSFLRDRLSLTADYYIRKTDNILLSQTIPNLSGFSSMTRNVGGMENRGVELTIGWKDDVGDFSYNIDGNVSFMKNTVTNLGTAAYLSSSFAYDYALTDFQGQFNSVLRSEVGLPYNQFYGYNFLGIFQNQAEIDNYKSAEGAVIMPKAKPGDSMYEDYNKDGKISSADMQFIGNPHPKAIYGLSFNAVWKNFDLSLLFQGVFGNKIFNASKFYFNKFDGRQNVLQDVYMKAWDGEGTSNTLPIILSATTDKSRIDQNWWQSNNYIEDGSYFRLKNLQFGYTIKPQSAKANNSFRLYLSIQNLFIITKYSGIDPEIPGNGIDCGQYPQPRTFMLGANINF